MSQSGLSDQTTSRMRPINRRVSSATAASLGEELPRGFNSMPANSTCKASPVS